MALNASKCNHLASLDLKGLSGSPIDHPRIICLWCVCCWWHQPIVAS